MLCFLCGKKDFTVVYSLKTKNILRCRNDGLFLGEATASGKINVYKHDYFDNPPHPLKLNQSYFLKKLETIKLITDNRKPKTLDIGCGWGDFEEVLEKEKIPYLGIDTNKEAIKICRKKGLNCIQSKIQQFLAGGENGKVPANAQIWRYSPPVEHLREGNFRQNLPKLRFDSITMFQVIEHLKNPLPVLKTAKKLLKKNGLILITTPNNDSPLRKLLGARWSVYNEPSHYVFYDKKTLKRTLKLAGFKNSNIKLDQMRFLSLKYILKRLKQMYFPNYRLPITDYRFLSLPIPTDPFGDLEAIAGSFN